MLSEELIKQNHEICLELLDKFIEVCNDNNITYYISEGSAIGVMRHHGFIPWDINVDVIMTVEEFNKLDVIMKKLDLGDMIWDAPGGRICPMLLKKDSDEYKVKPNIDVGIYGKAPDNRILRKIVVNISFFNIKMFKLKNTDVTRKFPYNFLKIIASIFPNKFYYKILDWLKNMDQSKQTKYMMALTPSFFGDVELMESAWFGNSATYGDFEGRKVRIVEKCHEYLTHRYGDYMTPVVWEGKGDNTGCFYDRN